MKSEEAPENLYNSQYEPNNDGEQGTFTTFIHVSNLLIFVDAFSGKNSRYNNCRNNF